MAGIALKISIEGLNEAISKLGGLDNLNVTDMLEQVGGLGESFARERIDTSKQSPDGSAWPKWSPNYARTRHSGHSMLDGDGNLADSITYIVGSGQVSVGSPLIYAAVHQFGYDVKNIPARPYLGLSAANENEITDLMNDYLSGVLHA